MTVLNMGFINIIVLAISFYGCIGGKVPYSDCVEGTVIVVTKCGTCYCGPDGYWGPWQACIGICDEEHLEATDLLANDQLEDQFRQAQGQIGTSDLRTRTEIPLSLYPSAPIPNEFEVQYEKQDYGERNQPSYKNKLAAKSSYSGPVIEYEPEYYVLDY